MSVFLQPDGLPEAAEPGEVPEDGEEWELFDPHDFSAGDWQVIREALRKQAVHLEWRSKNPSLPRSHAATLREAAERRFELARNSSSARLFTRARERAEGEKEENGG